MTTTDSPLAFRATSLWTAGLGVTGLVVAYGFWESDTDWTLAWVMAAGLYFIAAAGLFQDRPFALPFARGIALFGTGAFLQAFFALGFMPIIGLGAAVHAVMLLSTAAMPSQLSKRQGLSLTFASAALIPAAGYALAPEQSGTVALAVLGGAALVWLGVFGVARGRTWGLLVALVGAPILATTVFFAPALSFFIAPHFLVSAPLAPLMLDALGSIAALGAILAVLPFFGPMIRFLRAA
jgi:hypothetical protein